MIAANFSELRTDLKNYLDSIKIMIGASAGLDAAIYSESVFMTGAVNGISRQVSLEFPDVEAGADAHAKMADFVISSLGDMAASLMQAEQEVV